MRPWPWLLPFAIAAAITVLSHSPAYPMDVQLPPPLDKAAHLLAFGTLAAAADWAWTRTVRGVPAHRRQLLLFLAACLFGGIDELHQSFVPGRMASYGDALADALGAALGLGLRSLPALRGRRLGSCSWVLGQDRRPDPGRPLVLVADPHWTSDLTGLAAATEAHPEADWLILGDVFDFWVAGLETEAQERFLAWAGARRRAGRWVGLWTGNRDYFLDRHAGRFDYLGEGTGGGLPEEALAFEHGDLVNGVDLPYRAWNLVSRSAAAWLLVRLLPGPARRLAARLERRLRTAGRGYRLAFPEAAFAAAAAERSGWTFLTGHFHVEHRIGNGIALPWAHEGRFMVWRDGRVEPLAGA